MAVVTVVVVVDVVAVTAVGIIISRGTRRRSEVCHVWRSIRRHGERGREVKSNRKERIRKGEKGRAKYEGEREEEEEVKRKME